MSAPAAQAQIRRAGRLSESAQAIEGWRSEPQ
jgi:hypothetical protein